MNIQRIDSANVSGIYKKKLSEIQPVAKNTMKSDDLVLSESGQIFKQVLEAVKNQPEVNDDKVRNIAKQIKSKSYQVNSDSIADKIIKGASFDAKI